MIPLKDLRIDRSTSNRVFEATDEGIKTLAETINTVGMLHPIWVRTAEHIAILWQLSTVKSSE